MLKEQLPNRGLGWAVLGPEFSHGGSSGTFAWGDPKTGVVGILFLQCTDDQGKQQKVTRRFAELVHAATKE
jgi:CubicO group peptidase (beta-lactamase class C family)